MDDKKTYILIVDDDSNFVNKAEKVLYYLGDVIVDKGYSEEDFYSYYKPGKYNAIILDLRLKSNYEGMDLLEHALNEDPAAPIVVLTGYASIETAVRSLQLGAKDYLQKEHFSEKPFLSMIERIIIEDKAKKIAERLMSTSAAESQIIGTDIKIKRIIKFAENFAKEKESPVLLVGEVGTEKEQIAKYIYKKSKARGKFIVKYCKPEEGDICPELFGNDKNIGLIKAAQGGLLYLDEVFSLDYRVQEKFLDFINTGKLIQDGQNNGQTVKCQIILSTTYFTEQILKNKNTNSNFFYRVKTPEILIPPLRERGNDTILLAQYYLSEFKNRGKVTASSINNDVLDIFKTYPWPGNLSELNHIMELSAMNARLDNAKEIKRGHLPFAFQEGTLEPSSSTQINLDKIIAETTLKYMKIALEKSQGAKIEAYQYLGYPESKRGTLNSRFKKYFKQYPDLTEKHKEIYKLYRKDEGY